MPNIQRKSVGSLHQIGWYKSRAASKHEWDMLARCSVVQQFSKAVEEMPANKQFHAFCLRRSGIGSDTIAVLNMIN